MSCLVVGVQLCIESTFSPNTVKFQKLDTKNLECTNCSMTGTGSVKLEQPVSKTSDNARTIVLTQHNSEYNTEEQ